MTGFRPDLVSFLGAARRAHGLRSISSITPSAFAIVLVIFLIAFALRAAFLFDYLSSRLLIADDTIFVGSYLLKTSTGAPAAQVFYYGLLRILSALGSAAPPKLALLLMQSAIAWCAYRILFRFSESRVTSVCLGLAIALFPVAVDQTYFMSGAHPTAGALLFFASCVILVEALFREQLGRPVALFCFLLVEGSLLLLTGFASPIFTLGPAFLIVIALLVLAASDDTRWFSRRSLIIAITSLLPLALYAAFIHNHHYGEKAGWVDMSIEQIKTNLQTAMQFVFVNPFAKDPVVAAGYLVGFGVLAAILLAAAITQKWRIEKLTARRAVLVAGFLLLASALTFAPGSVITEMQPRYVAASFMIAALALSIPIAILLGRTLGAGTPHKIGVLAGLSLIAGTAVIHNVNLAREALAPELKSHSLIVETLSRMEWKDDDQILVLLPQGYASPTKGLNHWSSWYLRVVTRKAGILGLIGSQGERDDLNASSLFVEKYADHDPIYWGEQGGRAYRKSMMGLERGRPTYVFSPSSDSSLSLVPLLLWRKQEIAAIAPGAMPSSAHAVGRAGGLCQMDAIKDALILTEDAETPPLETVSKTAYAADGKSAHVVRVPPLGDGLASIKVVLGGDDLGASLGSAAYTETSPPMPLQGPDFSIYAGGVSYFVAARDQGPAQMSIRPAKGQDVDIRLIGCPEKFAVLMVGGSVAGIVDGAEFAGEWTLGRGFLQRFWKGHIKEFSVSAAALPQTSETH